jgi:hypothetical protein
MAIWRPRLPIAFAGNVVVVKTARLGFEPTCFDGKTRRSQAVHRHALGDEMTGQSFEKQDFGFALEVDGRRKAEFATQEGAEQGALELKRRFPMLQVRIYDVTKMTRHEVSA